MPKFLKITLIVLISVLLILFTLPYLFKDRLVLKVKQIANENLTGSFEFKDVSISLFRKFPNLSLSLLELNCKSYVLEDTTDLIKADEFLISLNLWDVLSQKEVPSIAAIEFVKPIISIIQYDSLVSNADIVKPDPDHNSNDSTSLELTIEKFKIINGAIHYLDQPSGTQLDLKAINHLGAFSFVSDRTLIQTSTQIDTITFQANGMKLLKEVSMKSDLNLTYFDSQGKFEVTKGSFNFNNLKLDIQGILQLKGDSIISDIAIKAPENQFKDLFSILPEASTADYSNVTSSGTFLLNASIKGIYSASDKVYPSWDLLCSVMNGSMKYPTKQLSLENVNLDLVSKNESPDAKTAYFNVNKFSFLLNNQSFEGSVSISNLLDNFKSSGNVKGQINLADVERFYPIESGSTMKGIVKPDLAFGFSKSDIINDVYDQIRLDGSLKIENLEYKSKELPLIGIPSALFHLSPKKIDIPVLELRFGRSDLAASGNVINPLNMMTSNKIVTGSITGTSSLIDLTEWMNPVANTSNQKPVKYLGSELKILNQISLLVQAKISKLIYPEYDIQNIYSDARIQGDQLNINTFTAKINENSISGSGNLRNVFAFSMYDQPIQGSLNLKATVFNADQFLSPVYSTNSNGTAAASEPFEISKLFHFDIDFLVDQFIYKPLTLNQVKGNLKVVNQEIQFHNLNSNALGGKMFLNGILDASNPAQPKFNFKYDLSKVQFSNTLNSFVSVKKLAPVLEYIQGFFNSSLIFQGVLGKDMFPVIDSINIDGIIETLEGSIKGFKPLEAIADKLKLNAIRNLNIKNTKNWITVQNGLVSIKDFNKKLDDIDLNINGTHRVSGQMDYLLLFKIPKNKVSGFMQSIKLEKGLEQLNGLLSKVGLQSVANNGINVLVNMKGGLTNPSFTFKLVNEKGESASDSKSIIENVGNQLKDTIQSRLEEETNKLKEKAAKEIDKYADSLKRVAAQKTEEYKNKVLDKAAEEAGKHVDSNIIKQAKTVLNNPLDSLAGKILKGDKKDVDKIKDKMKDWNPFKKDKK
ncbi:MAG: AsmA-like C-terminal region-containing protein [Saprospiraceae bacterium]